MFLPKPKILRLRYQLGELVWASWRPRMLVLSRPLQGTCEWPPDARQLRQLIDPNSDGIFCRGVSTGHFRPGLGEYGGLLSYLTHNDVVYSVSLTGSFQEYLKGFSAKSRQNLTRAVRRYGERQKGNMPWEVYALPEQMATFHTEAMVISQQTYQTRLLDVGLADGEDFIRSMCELASRGMARGYLLRDGAKAIAFAWCRGDGEQLIYDVIGYLPSAAEFSPGTILLFHILEDLFALRKFNTISFGSGEAQYKVLFVTDRQEVADVYFFLPKLRNRLLLQLHWASFRASAMVGAWLERIGLKQRVKRLLRSGKRR